MAIGQGVDLGFKSRLDWLAAFDCDVLVDEQTYQVFADELGHTIVDNPGSSGFYHTCAILHLPGLAVEVFSLSGKTPIKRWNWDNYRTSVE